jgi:AraC-like DNA-binding protein
MKFTDVTPDESISLFVRNILVYEESDHLHKTILPFFADGYPGIMFQMTENGLFVLPHGKEMPDFFLYGQTIHPIKLKISGAYKFIVFQLYPFVIRHFFNVNPKTLNDDCYDLLQLKEFEVEKTILILKNTDDFEQWQSIIASFLLQIFQNKRRSLDYKIRQAIELIIENDGALSINELREKIKVTERTLERRFTAEVGVSPKQFAKMIQFQNSLIDVTTQDFNSLTDIAYKNGFTDQSHFTKVFKAYTGKTPKKFKAKI